MARCEAAVWRKDVLRVCRDGKRRFRMHYIRGQCSRQAGVMTFCSQHFDMACRGTVQKYERRAMEAGDA